MKPLAESPALNRHHLTLVTTPTVQGKEIIAYCGVVVAEVIEAINIVTDLANEFRDGWGGRAVEYERHMVQGRKTALAELCAQAEKAGANAIVDLHFDYETLGEKNGMLMIVATGTAVVLAKTEKEKLADREHAASEAAAHYVVMGGREKGPFSLNQIRELVRQGTLAEDSAVRSESVPSATRIAELLGDK